MPPSGGKNGRVAPATTEDTKPDSRIDIDSGTDTQEKPWLRRFLLEHLNPVNLLPCFKKRLALLHFKKHLVKNNSKINTKLSFF